MVIWVKKGDERKRKNENYRKGKDGRREETKKRESCLEEVEWFGIAKRMINKNWIIENENDMGIRETKIKGEVVERKKSKAR